MHGAQAGGHAAGEEGKEGGEKSTEEGVEGEGGEEKEEHEEEKESIFALEENWMNIESRIMYYEGVVHIF